MYRDVSNTFFNTKKAFLMLEKTTSGIKGYVYTQTSITVQFASGSSYRYDVSEVLTKDSLKKMIKLAKSGKGLNSFLNSNPQIRKYGYLDTTLSKGSFKPY